MIALRDGEFVVSAYVTSGNVHFAMTNLGILWYRSMNTGHWVSVY